MKALWVMLINLIMAIPAGCGGIRIGGIFDNTLVSGLPVGVIRVTTMAFVTSYLSMVFILHNVAVHKNLLVRSQRLHSAASPLTFCFCRLSSRPSLSDLSGYFD
jgi:hypothetical protein